MEVSRFCGRSSGKSQKRERELRVVLNISGICRFRPRFVPWDQDLTREEAINHEAGHAVVAWYHGGCIGEIRVQFDGRYWSGGFLSGPHPSLKSVGPVASRLLAGEIAVRLRRGEGTRQIGLPSSVLGLAQQDCNVNDLWKQVHKVEPKADIARVLDLADQIGTRNWWKWLWSQHRVAERILRSRHGKRCLISLAEQIRQSGTTSQNNLGARRVFDCIKSTRMPYKWRRRPPTLFV